MCCNRSKIQVGAGAQGILNYATPPRYDDAPAPGDPLRTSRRGPEELFGYVAFDRYRTTNAVRPCTPPPPRD